MSDSFEPEVRVLEIGRIPLFKSAYPDQTTWIRTGSSLVQAGDRYVAFRTGFASVVNLLWKLGRGKFQIILLPAVDIEFPADATLRKKILRHSIAAVARLRLSRWLAQMLLRPKQNVIAFLDISDFPRIASVTRDIVPDTLCYFKRELYPTVSFSGESDQGWWTDRTEPISLPAPVSFEPPLIPKQTDVFFSGNIYTPVREAGLRVLETLASSGLKIDIVRERIPHEEYMQRMAASWLVWSPSGYGWDCYRHYEACLAKSVPVIDFPSAERVFWLKDREHCFYYGRSEGDLAQIIRTALVEKDRLAEMGNQARRHVIENHSRAALVRYMLNRIDRKLIGSGRPGIFAIKEPAAT
jgi:hypothetical protein